ncbi:MAG TPA: DUF1631 domain-containing protein, partial [Usitatibacteraceae bacterium]|nr:DUF1631 domain-containing protein [Usitatibacteraceae bacterium]
SLDAHARARARLSPHESAGVLTDCRDLALGRIVKALAGVLDRVEDELFQLAESSRDRETQNLYLDARTQARGRRPVIEAAFRRQFLEFFNRKVKGEPAAADAGAPPRALALLDDDELEHMLAVQGMAARLKAACEGELAMLSQRFGYLLEKPDLADEANPMSPETICGALKEACDQIEAGWKVRLTLLRVLEGQVAGELRRVYRDLNVHLAERQILPEIRPSYRRSPASPATGDDRQPGAPATTGAGPAPDVHAALARLLLAASAPADALSALPEEPAVSPATRGFVKLLTSLQLPGSGANSVATGLPNVIRELRESPQSSILVGGDAMTIDIVAMLFDFVFEDRQIPVAAKALLGRLQIPTLKVALLDRTFFSTRTHPARQLLDRLARAAIGLDESSARGADTLAKLEVVVGRVLDEFDDDLAVFATLAADMESFLARQDQAEEAIALRTARLVEGRERLEMARVLAEDEVDRRIAAREWVPEAVRAMLEDIWVRALATVHVEQGEGCAQWAAMLATVDELLWSVERKSRTEDRRRLVARIPALVRSLQEGMSRAGVADAISESFLGELVDCHADAVRAGLKGTVLAGQPTVPEPGQPRAFVAPALERALVPAGDVHIEEIRLRSPRGQTPVPGAYARSGIWTNVKRHTWVEFRREVAQPIRARLTWISPARGVYLFTNANASAAISVSPEALAELMRRGEARIVDDAPLVDRVVDSMLASLREGVQG